MTAPTNKTMLNYFTKLPSKTCIVEEANPRQLAPAYNKQHVETFQKDRLEQFDAELYRLNNVAIKSLEPSSDGTLEDKSEKSDKITGVEGENRCTNYIRSIKSGQYIPFKISRKKRGPLRAKLLQYSEDVRPAYFGTWQKKSNRIRARRPHAMDETVFDYDVDSEAEWDIGGPGESLKGDDSEDDEELDDYEIDMKTFVPHGYVSDDEVEVHSDREENGPSSANQSLEEETVICDADDNSSGSVKIVGEKRMKLTSISTSNKQQGNHISKQSVSKKAHQQPGATKQVANLSTILGIHYENQQATALSESKIHFLQSFRGFLCS